MHLLDDQLVEWPYEMPLDGMQLTAQWQLIENFTVSFDINYEDGTDPESQDLQTGDTVVLPEVEREGYFVSKWIVEGSDPEKVWDFETDLVTQDMTLVAIWEENPGIIYATDLFISEYIEGSSNNKALEIYNGTGATINLSGYAIKLFTNGASSATNTFNLSGTLNHNEVLVISHNDATSAFKPIGYVTSGVTNFNGDDAIGLYNGDTLIDQFGVIGTDPGTAWNTGGISTLNKTLVRKSTVTGPNNIWDPSEWIQYDQDTSTYLGSHTFDPQ